MKHSLISLVALTTLLSCGALKPSQGTQQDLIRIEYPEVYELANIVLALTDYGLTDRWQVRKDFAYYQEMKQYFEPYKDHPLLDSANFSKARWEEYLSFRTDAYVFVFEADGSLRRINDFSAFRARAFDRYLPLIEDFARKSDFRTFFRRHQPYYSRLVEDYQRAYMLLDMKNFLVKQFDDYASGKRYSIVLSPFVYAQNLHRNIDSIWVADFPTIPKAIITGEGPMSLSEKSTELHVLFTEMDHAYVNPTSEKYAVDQKFQEALWEDDSGYAGYGDAVFNEYMTWAIFDIFNKQFFPAIADEINLYWHFQNDSRGFPYSALFANQVAKLYNQYGGQKKISDLYPEILAWSEEVQTHLSKPNLINVPDSVVVTGSRAAFILEFSEPMQPVNEFSLLVETDQGPLDTLLISAQHKLHWKNAGQQLSFELDLPSPSKFYLTLNWWGTRLPLYSTKGILLKSNHYLTVVREP